MSVGGEVGGELELDGLAPSRQLLPRKWCLGGERGGAGAGSRDHHEEGSRWGRMEVTVRKTWRAGRLGSMTSQLGVTGDVAWRSRGDGEVGEDDGLDGGEDLEKL